MTNKFHMGLQIPGTPFLARVLSGLDSGFGHRALFFHSCRIQEFIVRRYRANISAISGSGLP